MPVIYPSERLKKYASVQGGFAFKSSDFKDFGVPVLKIKNVRVREVDTSELDFVSQKIAGNATRYYCRHGDLLISMTGSGPQAPASIVGRVARFTGPDNTYLINQRVGRLIIKDPNQLNPRYLFYILTRPEYHQKLVSTATGSANQANISSGQIEALEIPVPPFIEQCAISDFMGVMDDKIELNRKINETLETIAQSIFKSWFIDFDPVRSKMEGQKPFGMDDSTAALFPDSFEDSELGEIPKGWRISAIGDEVRVLGGSTPGTEKSEFWENGTIHWVTPKDLSNLSSPILLDTERQITEIGLQQIGSGLLPIGTVLLSSRAPIGYLVISEIPVAVNQGFIAMVCKDSLPNYYVHLWTKQNMETIKGRANGTTFMEISKTSFRPIPVLVPTKDVLAQFQCVIEPLHRYMVSNLRESHTLAIFRDTLLPKLLSGKIRVGEN